LESLYADTLEDHIAELAHHYARSGNPQKAVEYCTRACRQSADRGSFAEAVGQFETGLELLKQLPDDDRRAEMELDLRIAAGFSVMTTKGYASSEAEELYAGAKALSQRPGLDWEKAWWVLFGLARVLIGRPDPRGAGEIASELVARAEERGSIEHLAMALYQLAFARMLGGDFEQAAEAFDRGIALWELIPGVRRETGELPFFRVLTFIMSAWNLWFLGYPDRPLERLNSATAIAHESDSKVVLGALHAFAGRFFSFAAKLTIFKRAVRQHWCWRPSWATPFAAQ
jgi:tetratricopeptide (TPR) repeat protein